VSIGDVKHGLQDPITSQDQ